VMARYNPFAEKAGMIRVCEKEPDPRVEEAISALEGLGLDARLMASERYCLTKLSSMPEKGIRAIKDVLRPLRLPGVMKALKSVKGPYPKASEWEQALNKAGLPEIAKVLSALAEARSKKIYLIWRSPHIPFGSCPLDRLLREEWREKILRSVMGDDEA